VLVGKAECEHNEVNIIDYCWKVGYLRNEVGEIEGVPATKARLLPNNKR